MNAIVIGLLILLGRHHTPTPLPIGAQIGVVCPSWGCGGYPWPRKPLPAPSGHVCPSWGCGGYPWPLHRLP